MTKYEIIEKLKDRDLHGDDLSREVLELLYRIDAKQDYMPGACPLCGEIDWVTYFICENDKGRVRFMCPKCGGFTDYFDTIGEAFDAWIDGKVDLPKEAG